MCKCVDVFNDLVRVQKKRDVASVCRVAAKVLVSKEEDVGGGEGRSIDGDRGCQVSALVVEGLFVV